jgi:hypothetical protein
MRIKSPLALAGALVFGVLGVVAQAVEPNWTVREVFDDQGVRGRCVLESAPQSIDDGHGETRIFLQLDEQWLRVITDSNIDVSFDDIALRVDDKEPIPMDGVQADTQVLFEESIATIIEQFIPGLKVDIHLRFWPTWPTTGVKKATFSLIGFTAAYEQLPACRAGAAG